MADRGGNVVVHPSALRLAGVAAAPGGARDFRDSIAQLERALHELERVAASAGERVVLRLVRCYGTELQALRSEDQPPDILAPRLTKLLDELREFTAWFVRYSGLPLPAS